MYELINASSHITLWPPSYIFTYSTLPVFTLPIFPKCGKVRAIIFPSQDWINKPSCFLFWSSPMLLITEVIIYTFLGVNESFLNGKVFRYHIQVLTASHIMTYTHNEYFHIHICNSATIRLLFSSVWTILMDHSCLWSIISQVILLLSVPPELVLESEEMFLNFLFFGTIQCTQILYFMPFLLLQT